MKQAGCRWVCKWSSRDQEGLNGGAGADGLGLSAVQFWGVKRQRDDYYEGCWKDGSASTAGAEGPFPFDCPMLAQNTFFFISVKFNFKPEEFPAEANF